MKKALLVADVHDDLEALHHSAQYGQMRDVDYFICVGDMALRPYTAQSLAVFRESGDVQAFLTKKRVTSEMMLSAMRGILEEAGFTLDNIIVVDGNYDTGQDVANVFERAYKHRRCFQIGEAKAMGYGGADENPPHIDLLEQMGEIKPFDKHDLQARLVEHRPVIGIIHNPPLGLCDDLYDGRNVGVDVERMWIDMFSPKAVFVGHIHEAGIQIPGEKPGNPNGCVGIRKVVHPKTDKVTYVFNPGNLGRFGMLNRKTLVKDREFKHGTFGIVTMEDDGTPVKLEQLTVRPDKKRGVVGKVRPIETFNLLN